MVYAGYFFGQYPCGWLIGRYPTQRVLGISCFLWGATVIIMTQCRSYSSALAVRFIMGIFEAAVTPGLTLMTGFWYTRQEIPLRQCIWYSSLGWGGIIGSYISTGVSKLPADLKPERWELIFYILGGATCLWAFVLFFLLPDTPANARFLKPRERLIAVKRVASNESGIKNKSFSKQQAIIAFKDPKALLIFTSVFAAAIPNGVVNSFSTIIIKDLVSHCKSAPKTILTRYHLGFRNYQNNAAQICGRRRTDYWSLDWRYHNLERSEFKTSHSDSCKYYLHCFGCMHGVSTKVTYLESSCVLLVGKHSIYWIHSVTCDYFLQYGWIYSQVHGKCHDLVSRFLSKFC